MTTKKKVSKRGNGCFVHILGSDYCGKKGLKSSRDRNEGVYYCGGEGGK